MPKGCCKNTQTQLSVDDNQQAPGAFNLPDFQSFIAVIETYSYGFTKSTAIDYSDDACFYAFNTGPPKTPIYIQFRSLRI